MQWLHATPEWFDRQKNPGNCDIYHIYVEKNTSGYIYRDESSI